MTKRQNKVTKIALWVLAVMMAVCIMLPGFVVQVAADPADPADPTPQDLEITSYDVRTKDENGKYTVIPKQITKDMPIQLTLNVYDAREAASKAETVTPNAKINTSSFTGSVKLPGKITTAVDMPKSYSLVFTLTYTGTGDQFQCDIFYNEKLALPVYTYTLTLNQCIPYVAPPEPEPTPDPIPEPTPEPDSSEPIVKGTGFVLKSVSFGGVDVQAGASFDLVLSLLSTNGTYNVENVAVAVTPSKEFSIGAGASNIYVGTVAPNKTIPVTIPLIASATVEDGSYTVALTVTGVNANDGTAVSAEITITIPITQPDRFEFGNMQMPDYLVAGMDDGSGFATVNLVNKGKTIIYNVSVTIEGEGISTDMGTQFVGNINPGTESGADFNIMADMPGQTAARVVVSYETAKGEAKEMFHEFTIDVQDGGDFNGGMDPFPIEPEIPESTGMPFWVWLAIGVAGVGIIITVIIVVRKKRKAKKDAALNDDFDDEA